MEYEGRQPVAIGHPTDDSDNLNYIALFEFPLYVARVIQ